MGAALPYIMAGATAVSAIGAIQQGEAGRASANYQAQVALNNAQIARENSAHAVQVGETSAFNQQAKTRQTVGVIIASQGANNLDVNSGSNLDVQNSARTLGQVDALTIKNNAAREAWSYTNQATSETSQAGLLRSEGAASQLSGFINAGSSIVGGASSIGRLYWPGSNVTSTP